MSKLKFLPVLFLFGCAASSADEPADKKLTTAEVSSLGARSWAQLECAAIASFSEDNAQLKPLFEAGRRDGLAFIANAKARPKEAKQIFDKVPMIMSWRLEGPSPDFMLGRVWEATVEYVGDELEGRDTWSHQERDPKAAPVDRVLRKALASNRFRERNCPLLIPAG